MGGDPPSHTPAPDSAATVAPFRAWRGSQFVVAKGPVGPPSMPSWAEAKLTGFGAENEPVPAILFVGRARRPPYEDRGRLQTPSPVRGSMAFSSRPLPRRGDCAVAALTLHGSTPQRWGNCRYFPTRQRSGMLPRLKACMEARPQRWGNCRYFPTRQRSGMLPRLKACMEARPQRWGNCRYFPTRQRSGMLPRLKAPRPNHASAAQRKPAWPEVEWGVLAYRADTR